MYPYAHPFYILYLIGVKKIPTCTYIAVYAISTLDCFRSLLPPSPYSIFALIPVILSTSISTFAITHPYITVFIAVSLPVCLVIASLPTSEHICKIDRFIAQSDQLIGKRTTLLCSNLNDKNEQGQHKVPRTLFAKYF